MKNNTSTFYEDYSKGMEEGQRFLADKREYQYIATVIDKDIWVMMDHVKIAVVYDCKLMVYKAWVISEPKIRNKEITLL